MTSAAEAALLERRRKVLGSAAPLFYDRPLHLVRGQGVWVEDVNGDRYLDAYNNVPHVGHCHPHVVEAICRQAGVLNIHTRYLHETVVALAERFVATLDAPLGAVTFCCTGTEANELALRIARHVTGNRGIIVSNSSYHGNSATLAGATTGLPAPEALAPYARAIRLPDLAGGPTGDEALAELAGAIASLQAAGEGVAALLLDTIFSSEGLLDVPEGWLKSAMDMVHAAGGLFIADEVQPGFGRTGAHMWGYQSHGLVPDFVTTGKPMGNGHPISAMATTSELLERFGQKALYFNTFGGNPVSCAAAMAVLDVIETEGLVANARDVGAYVQGRLADLVERHPIAARRRGRGLFFGLELVDPRTGEPASAETRRIVNRMRDEGVLISRIGLGDNVLKMRPPMVFTREHADFAIDRLDRILGETA
jgi:4-aminobutyrate aminotransferase-like enzyme